MQYTTYGAEIYKFLLPSKNLIFVFSACFTTAFLIHPSAASGTAARKIQFIQFSKTAISEYEDSYNLQIKARHNMPGCRNDSIKA
jgi:hypothetical protein